MWWIPIPNLIYFLVLYLYMSFENSHQNKMSSFKFIHWTKTTVEEALMIKIVNLRFFFSDMILFDIFCIEPIKVVALSINTYMFWMSIWICLMTIINTHTTGGECLLISPIHDKKWSLLPNSIMLETGT